MLIESNNDFVFFAGRERGQLAEGDNLSTAK